MTAVTAISDQDYRQLTGTFAAALRSEAWAERALAQIPESQLEEYLRERQRREQAAQAARDTKPAPDSTRRGLSRITAALDGK